MARKTRTAGPSTVSPVADALEILQEQADPSLLAQVARATEQGATWIEEVSGAGREIVALVDDEGAALVVVYLEDREFESGPAIEQCN